MSNLHYNIKEVCDEQNIDIDEFLNDIDEQHMIYIDDCVDESLSQEKHYGDEIDISSCAYALELDYDTNYTVKTLSQIMDFYKLNKRKLCKQEMIKMIVIYETDRDNMEIVYNRKRLWRNISELKKHEYFSKYILSEWC